MKRYKIETERADLFDINMMIVMSVTVRGKADCEQFELAYKRTVESYEILNTRVVIDEEGNAYYEIYDKAENGVYYTDKTTSELISEQEKKRFRIEDGEFLRLFINEASNDVFQLHFMMHHLGGDGKSLCYFIESFLRSLNGETINRSNLVLLNQDTLPKGSSMPFWIKLYVDKYNRAWEKESSVFGFRDMDEAYVHFWKKHQTETVFFQVEEEELKTCINKCHARNIGYTSYYIAEQIQDSKNEQDIGLAVDGRTDKNRCMGNQATGISVKYKYNRKKDILENAVIIDKKMKKKLSNLKLKYFVLHFMASFTPTLIDAVNLEYAGVYKSNTSNKLAKLLGYGDNTKDLSITNLTILDIPIDYGEYHIESMWFVPPVISYGKNVIGMVTVNNKLYVTKHHYV